MLLFYFLLGVGTTLLVQELLPRWRRRVAQLRPPGAADIVVDAAGGAVRDEGTASGPDGSPPALPPEYAADPLALAAALGGLFDEAARPQDVLSDARFIGAAEQLARGPLSNADLLSFGAGQQAAAACLCLEALACRAPDETVTDWLLRGIDHRGGWRHFFILRGLLTHAAQPVAGRLLARLDQSWADPLRREWLAEFLARRQADGEVFTLDNAIADLNQLDDEDRNDLDELVPLLAGTLPPELREQYAQWQKRRTNVSLLRSIGRLPDAASDHAEIIEHAALLAVVDAAEQALCGEPAKPVVIVGEQGAGKSTAIALLTRRLRDRGWLIFEATATDIMADQAYLGMVEGRVRAIIQEIEHRRVLWVVPEFHELLHSGRTVQAMTGILDHLFPYLERGGIRMVGETQPLAFAKLLQQRPRLRGVLQTVSVTPLAPEAAAELTGAWSRARGIQADVVQYAQQLAGQHLGEQGSPGGAFRLLKLAVERVAERGAVHDAGLARTDVLAALTALTGLPRDILDEHAALDLPALRQHFAARVLGQDEAVDALVERVALIKAGLTDPTRPQGVFLFVGPTGTGKTELAKALAAYLFGSPDRMIRLDMSEFQDPATLTRLLGSRGDSDIGVSIVDEVRRQPFSVVLLDELEKAHPGIWDLFLQLFDDGRLTDMNGSTASFRSTIIIMTSNLGGATRSGGGIGFGSGFGSGDATDATPASLQRLLEQTFRPEFVNRIDRIVPFRPLPRSIIRKLLDKEIRDVLGRRGLRDRAWALEWEESAIDLLIHHGFSPTLGARPLKRAVERYLLTPLALSIVGRQVPAGDQFLLIGTAGDRLTVEFVDPDSPAEYDDELAATSHDDAAPTLEDIVRDPRGDAAEVDALGGEYEHLRGLIDGRDWQERKHAALADTASADFWASPRRYDVLGRAEYMDRVEVGLDTAGSLLRRLNGGGRADTSRFPRELVRRLAQQLYLVGEAVEGIAEGKPRDAFIRVAALHEPGSDAELANAFAARIADMYRRWADRRGMRTVLLQEQRGDAAPYSLLLAVSGFAAYSILANEHGQHVLEAPGTAKSFSRARTLVRIAPQPDQPPSGSITLLAQALCAMEANTGRGSVVRRYREEPSPLVRDAVRGWRSGRLDQVLGGDFDLMG